MNEERFGANKQADVSANLSSSADTSPRPDKPNSPVDATDTSASVVNSSRRGFLKGFAGLSAGLFAAGLSAGEQTPAQAAGTGGTPGAAKPWQARRRN